MEKYSDLFKDPRWQKLRLQVLERDDFSCKKCGDKKKTLHVHHRFYESNKKPWEYNESALVTLCESCHQAETECIKEVCDVLVETMKEKFFSGDIHCFTIDLHFLKTNYNPEDILKVFRIIMNNQDIQKKVMKLYPPNLYDSRGKKRSAKNTIHKK